MYYAAINLAEKHSSLNYQCYEKMNGGYADILQKNLLFIRKTYILLIKTLTLIYIFSIFVVVFRVNNLKII